MSCGHPLCDLIGGACSIATGRSRGCTASPTPREIAPEVADEVHALVPAIEQGDRDAAIRLAAIVRREARDDRNVLVQLGDDEPGLGRLLVRSG